MAAAPHDLPATGSVLRRRFRRLRAESVLLAPGTSILLAMTAIAAVVAHVAAGQGLLMPWAWIIVAAIGGAATVLKVTLDLADRSSDPALWRQLLTEYFDPGSAEDAEIRRLTTLVIDLRARLAEAEVHAESGARALVADTLPALDGWIEGIGRLAGRLTDLRQEGRIQADLARSGRSRLEAIETKGAVAADPDLRRQLAQTAEGMRQQIRASERFRDLADSAALRLEHAVAALGTMTAQVMMVMARGSDIGGGPSIGVQISQEVAAVEGLILALDRVMAGELTATAEPDRLQDEGG